MSQKRKTLNGRALAAAAVLVLAGLGAASAEPGADAYAPASAPALVAPTAASTPNPAVAAPDVRPVAAQPAKPVALHTTSAQVAPSPAACAAPPQMARLDHPLLRTARRLAGNQPLVIVAIGSSSTAGAGASSPAASYPSRLAVELRKLFRGRDIVVINRGVNGEEVPDMMARFATGVIAEHPQLVLWQLGTNSVLRDQPLKPHARELHQGIEELKATGADVVLIDPQFSPKVLAKPETPGMVEQIALAAKDENVDLFPRFAIMRDWYERQHYSFGVFVSPDGLHMNDWGYACWAKLLAASVAAAAYPPVASALPQPVH
jgi:acyl-CoA thioesterase I